MTLLISTLRPPSLPPSRTTRSPRPSRLLEDRSLMDPDLVNQQDFLVTGEYPYATLPAQ